MTDLLIISLGPVQDFIAAARRTRDLQAGSELLSEVANAAAKALAEAGAELIFPASTATPAANKLVALIPSGTAEAMTAGVKDAGTAVLTRAWSDLAAKYSAVLDSDLAHHQLATFLEVAAAAVPSTGNYTADRKACEALLNGRKALRDFSAYTGIPGREKSPLDPARETVILLSDRAAPGGSRIPSRLATGPLWLAGTEFLDALSLIKRNHGRGTANIPTPSTGDLALAAVGLNGLAEKCKLSLDDLEDCSNRLEEAGLTLADAVFGDPQATGALAQSDAKKLSKAGSNIKPYYAVLVADGDHVGRYLDALSTPAAHRAFSVRLSDFAKQAAAIVKAHKGHPVYCGGDDALALIPYTSVLACANELAETYATAFPALATGEATTLSVGVAIVHIHHPLQQAIGLGRAAEANAKTLRNAISLTLHTRGGAPTTVLEPWDAKPLEGFTSALADMKQGVSRGLPYELRELVSSWPTGFDTDLLRAELQRICKRKTNAELKSLPKGKPQADLAMHIDKLVIARWMTAFETEGGDA